MRRILFLVVFILLLVACSQNTDKGFPKQSTITHSQLIDKLEEHHLYVDFQTILVDSDYEAPTKEWIENVFNIEFERFLSENGVEDWGASNNDCDNFAAMARSYGQLLHFKFNHRKTAITFGEFHYITDNGRGSHAINILLINVNGKIEPFFYEPQSRRFVSLTEKEKESKSGVIF